MTASLTPAVTSRVQMTSGPPFLMMLAKETGLKVWTNRSGDWLPETKLMAADLIMPEFDYAEWSIAEIT